MDLNDDDLVNVLDVVLLVNHIIGESSLSQNQLTVADFNTDSLIDILDVVLLVNIILNN